MNTVIFDMDGVIIDSEVIYIDFFKKVLQDFDVEISEEDLFSLAGLNFWNQNFIENLRKYTVWWKNTSMMIK